MPRALGELAQRVLAAAPVQVRAGHDHRPLGVGEQRDRAVERGAVGLLGARRVDLGRLVGVGLHEHDVEREVEEHRAAVRALRDANASSTSPGISGVAPAVAASLTTGRTNGTWSISCSEPWPQRNAGARPPSTTIGEWFC